MPPTLSVCCLTRGDGRRVAAVLSPLRAVADEIVIAADSRVDDERLAAYAAVANRVLRVEFDVLERHLGWLHAECAGDWVLRLDDDEVVGAELLTALPDLIAADDVLQYRIPRRWLHPDPGHWLDETPWSLDLQTRLVRTGPTLRFPGELHTSAHSALPYRITEAPIYHLAHLLEDADARRGRALRYEVVRPGLRAPGGGPLNAVYYVPEDWARRAPAEVPVADREAIARALAGADATGPVPDVTVTPREENDRLWAGRPLAEADYAARLSAAQGDVRLAAGDAAEVVVRVVNDGGATWPWGLDQPPHVRLAHRWLDASGDPVGAEHARAPFTAPVASGATALVPLGVRAPAASGDYGLEVDVVHEGVRWFGCATVIPCAVVAGAEPPAPTAPPTLRRRPRRGGGETRIPQVVHRVWLGAAEMPVQEVAFGEGWARLNPGWEVRLWTDADVTGLISDPVSFARARNHSERSDVLRYEVLARHGGVYVDTDVECVRSIAPLLGDAAAVAAYEAPGRLGTAVIGAVAGHPLMRRAVAMIRYTIGAGVYPNSTGPVFFTALARPDDDLVRFPASVFYPYGYDEPHRRDERFPEAYAVHHWAQSWG